MERVPEPEEVMADAAQAGAYARADFADVNQGLVDRFVATFPDPGSGRLLDLGTGPADIPIRFCRALPGVRVCGVDASRAMLALGREAVRGAGLEERVSLVQAYLPGLPFAPGRWDAVFSNSLLHHLRQPAALWEAIRLAARPGAPVLVCDLFRPADEATATRIVADAAGEADPLLQRDFYNSLLAAFTVDEVRGQLAAAGLDGLQVEVVSERHLLVAGRSSG